MLKWVKPKPAEKKGTISKIEGEPWGKYATRGTREKFYKKFRETKGKILLGGKLRVVTESEHQHDHSETGEELESQNFRTRQLVSEGCRNRHELGIHG